MMRGCCAVLWCLAVVCAGKIEEEARAAAEGHLLRLMGLDRRPPPIARTPHVPRAMRMLYEHAAKDGLPRGPANTVRSFTHTTSAVDNRFPHHHRFRLHFNISSVPQGEIARGADLTLQREPGATGTQRLLVYDLVRPGIKGKSEPVLNLIDSVVLKKGEHAVTADALAAARRWLSEPKHNHGLIVQVVRDNEQERPHIRLRRRADEHDEEWRSAEPLLLLYTEDEKAIAAREERTERMKRAASRRQHRPHHRRKEMRETCRRKPLYVDFADVGWSDWIVAPQGYDAHYCQGDCPFPLADHLNGTNHAIVQTLVNSVNPGAVPKACCVPTQLSSISMLYMDEVNNVVLKNYQDMTVVGCGCR